LPVKLSKEVLLYPAQKKKGGVNAVERKGGRGENWKELDDQVLSRNKEEKGRTTPVFASKSKKNTQNSISSL